MPMSGTQGLTGVFPSARPDPCYVDHFLQKSQLL
jgi:hypothetical protein